MKTLGVKVSDEIYYKVKAIDTPSNVLRQALDEYLKNKEVNLSNNVVNRQNDGCDINGIHEVINGFKHVISNLEEYK